MLSLRLLNASECSEIFFKHKTASQKFSLEDVILSTSSAKISLILVRKGAIDATRKNWFYPDGDYVCGT